MKTYLATLLLAIGVPGSCVWAADFPGPSKSSIERMMPASLSAAHKDTLRLRGEHKAVTPLPGLKDFRAIMHAHAEDSAHTGGTRPEMLAAALKSGVKIILLSDHFRPPRDFINDSWRGLHDGVLFIPGSEVRGFLAHPTSSILPSMEAPEPEFIQAVGRDGGLIFLSHIEERADHSMTNLTGLEIYNRHYDAKQDAIGMMALAAKLTDPAELKQFQESVRQFPDEFLACQINYPEVYLNKWDSETLTRRLTGVAANDCHHNQILTVKMVDDETVLIGTNVDRDDQMRKIPASIRPGIKQMTAGHKPGDILARVDLDPYPVSFLSQSTHILASELTEQAVRQSLREGHVYVSHDWMSDPTGFAYFAEAGGKRIAIMGDERPGDASITLKSISPTPCHFRLIKSGKVVSESEGREFSAASQGPGVYRVEAWLQVGGESRPWIYSNPIYLR